jgi:DNA repair exonuclease SbcCD ATPase subunit
MFGLLGVIKPILISGVVLSGVMSFWYITDLKANLAVSQQNEQILKGSIEEQKNYIDNLQNDIAEIKDINERIYQEREKLAQQVESLKSKFNESANGDPRDFGYLAASKPKLIERVINNASKNAARCIEIATGSPLTQKEIDAKLKSEINNECPEIANPNYIRVTP